MYSGGGTNGIFPYGLMQGTDGALYGTAYQTFNAPSAGAIFKFQTNGGYTLLHSFSGGTGDGAFPLAAPFQASNGALYGTTTRGGSNNLGVIYTINPNGGSYQVLYNFGAVGEGGASAGRLVQGPGNVLFGTTYQFPGGLFKIGLDGSGFQALSTLSIPGAIGPVAGLAPGPGSDGSGAFFGVSSQASPTGQNGTVFVMLVNPPATITPVTRSTAGGQTIVFWPSWAVGYVLQTTTNLTSGNWISVSNAVPLTGARLTNNSPGAFFRLVWPQ